MHLKQPGFNLVLVDHLLKIKKQFKNSRKQQIHHLFTKINLIKFVFSIIWLMEILKIQQLGKASDKVLRDKAFNVAKNPKHDGYQRDLASMVYNFFDKKSAGNSVANN